MRVCEECKVVSYDSVEEYKESLGESFSGGTPVGYPGFSGSESHASSCSKVGGAPWQREEYERRHFLDLERQAEQRRLKKEINVRNSFGATLEPAVGLFYVCNDCGSVVDGKKLELHYDSHHSIFTAWRGF